MNIPIPGNASATESMAEDAAGSDFDSLLPTLDLTTVSGFIVPAQGSQQRLERLLSVRRQQLQRHIRPAFDNTVS